MGRKDGHGIRPELSAKLNAAMFGLDRTQVIGLVVLLVLTVLLTGPGLWSETWGWGWLTKKKDGKK